MIAEEDRLAELEDRERCGGPISNGNIMTLLRAHMLDGVDVIPRLWRGEMPRVAIGVVG